MHHKKLYLLFLLSYFFTFGLHAAKLDSSNWNITSVPEGINMNAIVDEDISTIVTLTNAYSLLIDQIVTNSIHRIYFIGSSNVISSWYDNYNTRTNPPLGRIVAYVGNTSNTTTEVGNWNIPWNAGFPIETEIDIRFNPTLGRYIRLDLQTNIVLMPWWPDDPSTNDSWNIAELQIHGFTGDRATNLDHAVIIDSSAAPLLIAARDLSYYLGELTGKPHPIDSSSNTNIYLSTIYRISDLVSLAPNYNTMISNINNGSLPKNVNITTSGREIVFNSWPYRAVMWSVWEFLERQGIRWLSPDENGDYIPPERSVITDFIPLSYTPSATSIYANFNDSELLPWPKYMTQPTRQGYLYLWRNRWNYSWNGYGPLGGAEIPSLPDPEISLNSEYTEKFDGYPHNFNTVIPLRILTNHPSWWGYDTNLSMRVNPTNSGAPAFCFTNTQMFDWVADKILNVHTSSPPEMTLPLNIAHFKGIYNLLPMDASKLCSCEGCLQLYESASNSFSGPYYYFISNVAARVLATNSEPIIGALAYESVKSPPYGIILPTNVVNEIAMMGHYNLPLLTSSLNLPYKDIWNEHRDLCTNLTTYDYSLLHTEYRQTNYTLIIPMIKTIVENAKFFDRIGSLNGGSQGSINNIIYNPWNFYAYPRIRWNIDQTSQNITSEFFSKYFLESSAPIKAFYQILENYHYYNDISTSFFTYGYSITAASHPPIILSKMNTYLKLGESMAVNWWVKNRISRIRTSFNILLEKYGLTEEDIEDFSEYELITTNSIQLNISKMFQPVNESDPSSRWGNYASWDGGNHWKWWAQGHIADYVRISNGGTYKITISAKGTPVGDAYPLIAAYFGSSRSVFTISSTNYTNYEFLAHDIPSGNWNIDIVGGSYWATRPDWSGHPEDFGYPEINGITVEYLYPTSKPDRGIISYNIRANTLRTQ